MPTRPALPSLRVVAAAFAFVALAPIGASSHAAWPERPIRLIHGFTAGGNVDIQARIVGAGIAEAVGQPVVIDMRPGAGGSIAAAIVAKAAPDGYTLFSMAAGHSTQPALYRKLPYDAVTDFQMITIVSSAPYVVAVGPTATVGSLEELVKVARSQPGKLLYATAGVGTGMFLVSALFQNQTGIQMNHVAYKGGTNTPTAVAQGEVPMMFGTFAEVRPFLDSGRLRVIGVTTPNRWERMPGVPTFHESVAPGLVVGGWQALAAPAKLPPRLLARLEEVAQGVLKRTDVQQRLREITDLAPIVSAAEAQRFLASEVARWRKVVEQAGIQPQEF